jgi:hypothetical protein
LEVVEVVQQVVPNPQGFLLAVPESAVLKGNGEELAEFWQRASVIQTFAP